MSSRDDWDDWLDALDNDDDVHLNSWESDFAESLRTQLQAGRDLTENQADKLEEVYGRHYVKR